ncbi:hypothetical protein [Kitasatospora sp. NBC_01266]|uniref:hypothetical protein n=1 Tax=Kitasatospora sp. NBC_01266 TaxID=2903572 RepID=UPI002E306C18|nr:hypothetical protein [Kitasatospora sp. NBC_01266]
MCTLALVDHQDPAPDLTLFVVDIEELSEAGETALPGLRDKLDRVLGSVFIQSGLGGIWTDRTLVEDTGARCVILMPTTRSCALMDPLIHNLDEALHRENHAPPADRLQLRIRASIHRGPLPESRLPSAINHACRYVDSDAVRAGLDVAIEQGSHTALIISDEVYRQVVVGECVTRLSTRDFLEVPATVGNRTFSRSAWLHVPRVGPRSLADRLPAFGRPGAAHTEPSRHVPAGPFMCVTGQVGTATNKAKQVQSAQYNFGPLNPSTWQPHTGQEHQ